LTTLTNNRSWWTWDIAILQYYVSFSDSDGHVWVCSQSWQTSSPSKTACEQVKIEECMCSRTDRERIDTSVLVIF